MILSIILSVLLILVFILILIKSDDEAKPWVSHILPFVIGVLLAYIILISVLIMSFTDYPASKRAVFMDGDRTGRIYFDEFSQDGNIVTIDYYYTIVDRTRWFDFDTLFEYHDCPICIELTRGDFEYDIKNEAPQQKIDCVPD